MLSLKDKTVIVTGAASGMGEQHARTLAGLGANVVLTDIQVEKGQEVAESIGASALFLEHDVSSSEAWTSVIATTADQFGPVAGLVNNAGIGAHTFWDDLDEEIFMKYMRTNALSVLFGMTAVVPMMKELGGGSIVNISSTAGLFGTPGALCYNASKFAVTGMTKVAAIDLGPFNIRVNSIHPGFVKTPLLGDVLEAMDDTDSARIPLGRMGEADELSGMVALLISDQGAFMTGAEYVIDGGQTCRD